jgi:hypothetical protein
VYDDVQKGSSTVTKIYFLHIVANESPNSPTTYNLSRSIGLYIVGGAMPTVHSLTWEKLGALLAGVGIHKDEIELAKMELDIRGSAEISEVGLTDSQIEQLGLGAPAA